MTHSMSNPVQNPEPQTRAQRLSGIAAGLGLLAVAIWMLTTFLPAVAWATVLTIATWPLFVAVQRHNGSTRAAAVVTVLIAVAVLAPLVVAVMEVAQEIRGIIRWYIEVRNRGLAPEWIASLPMIGPWLTDWLNQHLQDEHGPLSGTDVRSLSEWGRIIGGQAARRITTLLFALLIVFFMLRESDTLLRQFHAVGTRFLGEPAQRLASVAAAAVRGTVDGLLLIGIAQAALLGIAYAACGVPHPTLLGALTGLLSAIPFASPLVFIGAAAWLLMQSATIAAITLLAFGSAVVFVADHFARPALIGGSIRLPFVWVLLGILGGVESFGLLGLFLGPALLAVLITLWRELAEG
jgi:predicted PurR-regulated permease PerM